jgi:hypothetical protein
MRRWVTVAVVTATSTLGLAGAGPPVHAKVPGPNGRIVFERLIPHQTETDLANVLTADPDGTHIQQLRIPVRPEVVSRTTWSPDGTKLLIDVGCRVLGSSDVLCQPATMNADGSGFTLLPPRDNGCDVWSVDETRLLCGIPTGHIAGDAAGVFSVRATDGGDPVRLTTNPYGNDGADMATDISPDGTRFVFVRYRPGPEKGRDPFRAQQVGIFIANMDGSDVKEVVPYGVAQGHEFANASWSPDGERIISSTRQGLLFTVHPDGSGLRIIHLEVGTQRYFAFEPHWSPDGSRIVFCLFVHGGEGIYSADPDGSNVVRVTHAPTGMDGGADWGTQPPLG